VLKVNIYLKNISIKYLLVIFDQKKHVFSLVFFVCSLSASIINYACPNFQTICAMALMFTLQHEFELSILPSIPSSSRHFFPNNRLHACIVKGHQRSNE